MMPLVGGHEERAAVARIVVAVGTPLVRLQTKTAVPAPTGHQFTDVRLALAPGCTCEGTPACRRGQVILKDLEARLEPTQFVRLGRGTLVNVDCIVKVNVMPGGTHVALLTNGQKLQVSRLQSRVIRDRLLKL